MLHIVHLSAYANKLCILAEFAKCEIQRQFYALNLQPYLELINHFPTIKTWTNLQVEFKVIIQKIFLLKMSVESLFIA